MSIKDEIKDLENYLLRTQNTNTRIDFLEGACSVDVDKCLINNDITLYKNSIYFKENVNFESTSNENALCLNIVLKGNCLYKDKTIEQTITKKTNTMFLKYIRNGESYFEAKKDTQLKDIGILIKGNFLKDFLKKYKDSDTIEKRFENNISSVLKNENTNFKTSILAKEVYDSPFDGYLDTIFLQSKVYEIIYNEFSSLFDSKSIKLNKNIKLSNDDIKALHLVKKMIVEEKKYLTLNELSKKVALNEFKLKYGFKKLFDTTPGSMILTTRMQEGKKLLETSELNITEVSKLVGYKHTQSFTSAFKKQFNINPKDIMKNRKYYY